MVVSLPDNVNDIRKRHIGGGKVAARAGSSTSLCRLTARVGNRTACPFHEHTRKRNQPRPVRNVKCRSVYVVRKVVLRAPRAGKWKQYNVRTGVAQAVERERRAVR